MSDMESREALLQRDGLLIGIVMVALLNGQHFSPYFDPAWVLFKPFIAATFYVTSPLLSFYFTALMISTLTLMLGGIPAALFERFTGRTASDGTSYYIWLGGVLLLTLPTIMAMASRGV